MILAKEHGREPRTATQDEAALIWRTPWARDREVTVFRDGEPCLTVTDPSSPPGQE